MPARKHRSPSSSIASRPAWKSPPHKARVSSGRPMTITSRSPPAVRSAHPADQQAADIGRRIILVRLTEQHGRANPEQVGGKSYSRRHVRNSALERRRSERPVAWNKSARMLCSFKQVEQLAGHDGAEAMDPAACAAPPTCCACPDGTRTIRTTKPAAMPPSSCTSSPRMTSARPCPT